MRPHPHELDLANYPFTLAISPRYSDLDTLGHVNNVAVGNLMQEARMAFMTERLKEAAQGFQGDQRLVTVSSLINYLEEVLYPHPLIVGVAIAEIGNSSFTITHLLTQFGKPAAACRCVMVRSSSGKSLPLSAAVRGALNSNVLAGQGLSRHL